jgi:predicted HTH domain antitoxin
MYTCKLDIPDEIIRTLGLRENEVSVAIQKELSAHFFEKGILSFGQARAFSGMTKWDFLVFLHERKIPLRYDVHEYEEDIETIRSLEKL